MPSFDQNQSWRLRLANSCNFLPWIDLDPIVEPEWLQLLVCLLQTSFSTPPWSLLLLFRLVVARSVWIRRLLLSRTWGLILDIPYPNAEKMNFTFWWLYAVLKMVKTRTNWLRKKHYKSLFYWAKGLVHRFIHIFSLRLLQCFSKKTYIFGKK